MARELNKLGLNSPVLLEGVGQDPLDVLIATLLSQASGDQVTQGIFRELKGRYPGWAGLARAPLFEVEEILRRGGLAKQKSQRLKEILSQLESEQGALSLTPLLEGTDEQAMAKLLQLAGVGPKTAACVLLFALGRPVFPVDTHVLRVSRRLGWVGAKETAPRAQDLLSRIIPEDLHLSLHTDLIRFGREICRANTPRCYHCPLAEECDYARGRMLA